MTSSCKLRAYSWSARDDEAVYNGNRTEWSPIRSVIIWVIDRIVHGRPICLITSMITDRIGPNEVLLQINHNYNKICDVLALLKIKTQKKFLEFSCLWWKKKPFKCAHMMGRYYISVLFHWAFLFVVYFLSLFCCCSIKPFHVQSIIEG